MCSFVKFVFQAANEIVYSESKALRVGERKRASELVTISLPTMIIIKVVSYLTEFVCF
jgi:hypothetical protein